MRKTDRVQLSVLLVSLLLTNCGGGGGESSLTPASNDNPTTDSSDTSSLNDGAGAETMLFPDPGPVVDPASTREEIASRADLLIVEYRTLMTEVFSQIDAVYHDISSGVESSQDPDILANDVQFVNTMNRECDRQADLNDNMIGLFGCLYNTADFAFRHSVYSGVKITIGDYALDADIEAGEVTEIMIHGSSNSTRIMTRRYMSGLEDWPFIEVESPAFGIFNPTDCKVELAPTSFPTDSQELNRCSEVYRDIITVLQRLNDRS